MIKVLFVFFLFIVSCSDTVNNTTTNVSTIESDTSGDLYVYAKDAVSGELISDAEYSAPAIDDSSLVAYGDKGVRFQDLPVGENYAVYVSAEDYASVVCNASIKFSDNVTSPNMSFVDNTTLEVKMRKLSSKLKGSIYYQNPENPTQLDILPAEGAKVSLVVKDADDCSFLQKTYGPVEVDEDGFYSFDSLPEKAEYVLNVHDSKFKGFMFSGMEQEGTLGLSKTATVLPKIVFEKIQTAFGFDFVQDNRSYIQKDDSLKFSFSEPVNISQLQNKSVRVEKVKGDERISVAFDSDWTDSNKTLQIVPAFGEWEFNAVYKVSMTLYSALSAEAIDTTLEFSIKEFFDLSEDTVSILPVGKIDYNTASVPISWESMSGAEAYEVYAMVSSRNEKNYSMVGEVTTVKNGKLDTTFTLSTTGLFNNGNSVSVIVAARNEKNRSAFGEPVVLEDNKNPEFSKAPAVTTLDTANVVYNATTYFTTVAEGSITLEVGFNEPMNTEDSLEVTLPKDSPRKLSLDWTWKSSTVLTLTLKVKAGDAYEDEENLSLPIEIKGLKDLAGNKISESSIGKKSWKNLLVVLQVSGVTP
ncbi:MAG: hypothetical protein MJZ25_09910 [Fibrobacter sp.]|nr:hypothetical protein [Fibrobacter sp.]